uniref:Uncharacterized protein n=1 Tax=Neogobius melanostomus TaxID=47308 RepID=A0A8C6TA66_9GOBI
MVKLKKTGCLLSEEELQCSICLEVLTDPVSTPCGHTFCKHCITETWRVNAPCRAQPNVTQDHCLQHNKPLELFCESDHSCVCVLCSLQHQGHTLVPLKEACEAKQRELQKSQAHTQRMIQDRTQKISEVQQSLELIQKAAEEETAEGVNFFSALMEMIQKTVLNPHMNQLGIYPNLKAKERQKRAGKNNSTIFVTKTHN